MDIRRILVFLGISGLVLLAWNVVAVPWMLENQRQHQLAVNRQKQAAQEQAERERQAAARRDRIAVDAPVEAPRPGAPLRAEAPGDEAPAPEIARRELPRHPRNDNIHLGSLDRDSGYFMRVTLTTRGAAVKEIELNGHEDLENDGAPLKVISTVEAGDRGDRRLFQTFQTWVGVVDAALAIHDTSLSEIDWEIVDPPAAGQPAAAGSSVTFRYRFPEAPIEVRKRYELKRLDPTKVDLQQAREENAEGYELRMALTVRNTGSQAEDIRYDLLGPVGLPLENLAYARKFSDFKMGVLDDGSVSVKPLAVGKIVDEVEEIIARAAANGRRLTPAEASQQLQEWQQPFRFAGIDVQFFSGLVVPPAGQKLIAAVRPMLLKRDPEATHSQLSAVFTSDEFKLEPNSELSHEYALFAGPKQPGLLAAYDAGDVVEFGWFGVLSKAMLWLLNVFHGIGLPYGIAIICLTAVVRGAMFPLSKKQALGAAKMKELQPQIQELKKKYGDDKQKLTQAQMELFRKANYNPFAGCLPIFLQLPIFIGLYNGLYCSVELRNSSFLWIDNLAAPDALFKFPWGATPWVGWTTFNLLPIVTVALFIVQQKMFMPPPAADDEQAKMTYRMMNVMMVVMGFLFYGVPAGLCVYFIASSLWGIGERKLLERMKPAEKPEGGGGGSSSPPPGSKGGRPPASPGGNGDSPKGFWAKLMDMAEAAQSQRNEQKAAAAKDTNGAKQPGGARPKKRGKSKRR